MQATSLRALGQQPLEIGRPAAARRRARATTRCGRRRAPAPARSRRSLRDRASLTMISGRDVERLADGEADRADERRGVEAERNLVGAARVDERRDAVARPRDHRVDLARLSVRSATLHVAREQMVGHRLDHACPEPARPPRCRRTRIGPPAPAPKTRGARRRRETDGRRVAAQASAVLRGPRIDDRHHERGTAGTSGTLYCRPSTKNVVAEIAVSETIPNHAAARWAGILIGSRASWSARQRLPETEIGDQDDDPDEEHAGDRGAIEREERIRRRVDRQQDRRADAGAGGRDGAQRHAGVAHDRQPPWRIAGPRQRQQHPRRHVQVRIRARDRRGNHDQVHGAGGKRESRSRQTRARTGCR